MFVAYITMFPDGFRGNPGDRNPRLRKAQRALEKARARHGRNLEVGEIEIGNVEF